MNGVLLHLLFIGDCYVFRQICRPSSFQKISLNQSVNQQKSPKNKWKQQHPKRYFDEMYAVCSCIRDERGENIFEWVWSWNELNWFLGDEYYSDHDSPVSVGLSSTRTSRVCIELHMANLQMVYIYLIYWYFPENLVFPRKTERDKENRKRHRTSSLNYYFQYRFFLFSSVSLAVAYSFSSHFTSFNFTSFFLVVFEGFPLWLISAKHQIIFGDWWITMIIFDFHYFGTPKM